MEPSRRQQTVYRTWETTDLNILIQAVAGGAKTTTLMGLVQRSEYRCLILAFNKGIQEEFSSKIEAHGYDQARAMTLHALGLLAIRQHYGSSHVFVNKGKNYDLIKHLQNYNRHLFSRMTWEDKVKVTMTMMEMNDVSRIYLTDDMAEIFQYMAGMDKYYFQHDNMQSLWNEFLQIRKESYEEKVTIDFIDMIYLTVAKGLFIPVQPYYLMIDEAQDLNLAQHRMIDHLLLQGDVHKWVAVGDRHQSIYGFSGSYASSFDLFRTKGDVIELPLDVCYRCPSLIIDEANAVYDVMEGFKSNPGLVGNVDDITEIKNGSMIICRNTSPLIDLYFQLIGNHRKVYLKGEDIMGSIINFLKPYSYKTIKDATSKMTVELIKLKEAENKSDETRYKYYRMKQNYANFALLSKNYGRALDKVEVLIQTVQRMFDVISDDDAITLCTIHKSKGLEADIVYILNENLIPSKFAKSPSQLEQEQNLKYVARTRAREELYYLNLKIDE